MTGGDKLCATSSTDRLHLPVNPHPKKGCKNLEFHIYFFKLYLLYILNNFVLQYESSNKEFILNEFENNSGARLKRALKELYYFIF